MADAPTIEIVMTRSTDYRVVSANGVWGGVTPGGELRIDFYLDSVRPKDPIVHELKSDGTLGPAKAPMPARLIERESQVGIVISTATAEKIANWLMDKVNKAKNRADKSS